MQGWTEFARQVITALKEYDEKNKTYYSYYLMSDDKNGVKILSLAMQDADRKNQWEPIPQGKEVKVND